MVTKAEQQKSEVDKLQSEHDVLVASFSELTSTKQHVHTLERKLHVSKSIIDMLQLQIVELKSEN